MKRLRRIAILIVDKDTADTGYLDIGHKGFAGRPRGYFDDDPHPNGFPVLWVWDGSLHLHPLTNPYDRTTHEQVWREPQMDTWQRYRGRYDPDTHVISLVAPERFALHAVPEAVETALEQAFPDATQIVRF